MKNTFLTILLAFFSIVAFTQSNEKGVHGPTDTLLFKEFYGLPGSPTILTYGYSNGNGYFFGTNFIDIDQNASTPYENGAQAFAQGFPVDTGQSYYILDILVRVGVKSKAANSTGTPLILSLQYLDDSSTYNVNTSSGSISYTIHSPGTSLGSASIAYNDLKTGTGVNYSVAHFNSPVLVEKNFCVVVDLMDFYLNGDRVGLWVSPPNGGSNIYGLEYTLWLYPNPMLWLQVNHIYNSINRAIAIFPVVDDGTFGIENDRFQNGIKLGQTFPNPANDLVNFEYELENSANVSIEVVDLSGKIVFSKSFGKLNSGYHLYSMDISGLESGMYFYTLYTDNQHLTKRLIVE